MKYAGTSYSNPFLRVWCLDMTFPSGNTKVSSPTAFQFTVTFLHDTGMNILSRWWYFSTATCEATYSRGIACFDSTRAVGQDGEQFWGAKAFLKEDNKWENVQNQHACESSDALIWTTDSLIRAKTKKINFSLRTLVFQFFMYYSNRCLTSRPLIKIQNVKMLTSLTDSPTPPADGNKFPAIKMLWNSFHVEQ